MNHDLPLDQIRSRYEAGETAASIAESLQTTYQVIQHRLRQMGIPLRGRGPTSSGRQRLSELRSAKIDENLLRNLHSRRMSTAEIAQVLPGQHSEETVRRRMKRLGLARLEPKARMDRNAFWNGGLSVDADGYILQKAPGHPRVTRSGYVRQHRLVMESKIGRFLLPREVVDHVNGDTSDNRPENLRLFSSNGEHLRETRTGKAKLSRQERADSIAEAVRRATARVQAIREASGTGAGPSS